MDLQSKSMGWFLYDRDLRYKELNKFVKFLIQMKS